MYICVCNGLTDRQVRGLAEAGGASAASVYRFYGVKPQCGKCLPMMRDILRQSAPDPAGEKAGEPALPDLSFAEE